MLSPFPGMDPYLEGSMWPDVHATLLVILKFALVRVLPEKYSALVEQYVWQEGADEDDRSLLGAPDVQIARSDLEPAVTSGKVALAAPVVVTLPSVRRIEHRYLRITDRDRRRLVTVIELLSPSNKDPRKNRSQYLEKRNDYLATGVNLVEIDLLRAGERMPLGEPLPTPTDYCLLVARGYAFPHAELWPFSVRDRLPNLIVPLGSDEPDVCLELKDCTDRCYEEGQYRRLVNYDLPSTPALRTTDADWATEILKARIQK